MVSISRRSGWVRSGAPPPGALEDGPDVQRTLKRGLFQMTVAVQNQRRHFRAVAPLGNDTARLKVVGVVELHATVHDLVSKNGHSVEKGCNRRDVGRRRGLDWRTGAQSVYCSRKLGSRLRSDEHDVIADRQRRLLTLPKAQHLCRRQVYQGRFIRNLRNRCSAEDFTASGADSLFETGRGLSPPPGVLVAPELDLGPYRICLRFEFVSEPFDRVLGDTVQRPPRPKPTEAPEQVEPSAEASRRPVIGLIPVPKSQEFPERSDVGHREVQTADYRLVLAILAFPVSTGVEYREVGIRVELHLFVAEEIEARNTSRRAMEVVNRACDLQHERTFGSDAGRIATQGHRIAIRFEHLPEALKDWLEPLALPLPGRQPRIASASWSARPLIR